MRLAIIGRTEWLYDTAELLRQNGHDIGLVVTCREAPEYLRNSEDFRRLAIDCGAAFIQTTNLQAREVVDAVQAAGRMELGISINFPGILAQETIDHFPLGILNAHAGDLPRYRGNACPAWAIISGEARVGLCIHRMIGGELDSGDIIARAHRALCTDTRVGEVFAWIGRETPQLYLDAVTQLDRNPQYVLERQSTKPADAERCYPRRADDGRIDWRHTSEQVLRLINASSEPFGGAFCSCGTTRVTIWRAALHIDEERYLAVPGQIAAIDRRDGSVTVICGSGKLRITEISSEGGARIPPATLIRGLRERLT